MTKIFAVICFIALALALATPVTAGPYGGGTDEPYRSCNGGCN